MSFYGSMRMGTMVGLGLLAALALSAHSAGAEPAVAAFPLLPEENPTPQPAPTAPPAVGSAALPALAPAPSAPPAAAPAPQAAPLAPLFPMPAVQQPAALGPTTGPLGPQPVRNPRTRAEHDQAQDDDEENSKAWMVAVEGFTRVPLDMGIQAGIEFPIGLRASAGYGWVPAPYRDFLTRSLALSAKAGNNTAAVLREGFQGGRTLRVQVGIRPFGDLGFYLDAGFANILLEGAIDGSALRGVGTGEYEASTSIDTWVLELGYQAWMGRHFTMAAALGLSGTMSSTSELSGTGLDPAMAKTIVDTADKEIEAYGVLPTLVLRLGFDMI